MNWGFSMTAIIGFIILDILLIIAYINISKNNSQNDVKVHNAQVYILWAMILGIIGLIIAIVVVILVSLGKTVNTGLVIILWLLVTIFAFVAYSVLSDSENSNLNTVKYLTLAVGIIGILVLFIMIIGYFHDIKNDAQKILVNSEQLLRIQKNI